MEGLSGGLGAGLVWWRITVNSLGVVFLLCRVCCTAGLSTWTTWPSESAVIIYGLGHSHSHTLSDLGVGPCWLVDLL